MLKAWSKKHLHQKVLKAMFLIKVGQNWVVKGGQFSVVISTMPTNSCTTGATKLSLTS